MHFPKRFMKKKGRTPLVDQGRWQLAAVLDPLVRLWMVPQWETGAAQLAHMVVWYVLGNIFNDRDPGAPIPERLWDWYYGRLPEHAQWLARGMFAKTPAGHVLRWPKHQDATRRPISKALRATVTERDGYACRLCSSQEQLEIDHIFPWSLGGLHAEDNLQTLCKPCNVKKRDHVPD